MNIEDQIRDETFEQWYGRYFEELSKDSKYNIQCAWNNAWFEAQLRTQATTQNRIFRALVLDGKLTQEFVDNLIKAVKKECTDI